MYLNQFSVRIPEGRELDGGYVELAHGTVYTLVLRNDRQTRADAWVEVDGQAVGTFRLASHSTLRLERPAHDRGCFTFVHVGTAEAAQAGLRPGDPNLGLVRVVFTPEQVTPVVPLVTDATSPWQVGVPVQNAVASRESARGLTAGGTGLSGQSSQTFVPAAHIRPDVSQQTTIHLRLVASDDATVRPLTAFSTPVPPAV